MLKKITMPPGGQNTDRLMIAKWRKNVGESVKRGDVLLEVETDKAVLDVESFAEGTLLKRIGEEGDYATVGDVIAFVGKPGELEEMDKDKNAASTAAPQPVDDYQPIMPDRTGPALVIEPAKPQQSATISGTGRLPISPAAKKMIRDNDLEPSAVYQFLGLPIVHQSDVAAYLNTLQRDVVPLATAEPSFESDWIPLTAMRRTIAARMLQSTSTIPSFTAEVEIEMNACSAMRKELNGFLKDSKVSYNDIFARCVARAVVDYPLINASFEENGIKIFKSVNVGLAVSLDQGLVVPVVKNIAAKSLAEIARENAANIASVRSGKFDPELLEHGTFTLSNLGTFPVSRFTAIINPPQVCILAFGSIRMVPAVVNGQLQEKSVLSVTASFDHRVIDGAYGAKFLAKFKELVEHPNLLLV